MKKSKSKVNQREVMEDLNQDVKVQSKMMHTQRETKRRAESSNQTLICLDGRMDTISIGSIIVKLSVTIKYEVLSISQNFMQTNPNMHVLYTSEHQK